jgi:hypothetical protein
MKLGTHMPDGERMNPIDIEVVGQSSRSHCPSTCSQFGTLLIFIFQLIWMWFLSE